MLSIVVPAYNEEAVIGRLLTGLLDEPAVAEFEVVVVPNGCTDRTAAVADSVGPPVRVVVAPTPGKYAALRLGDAHCAGYPRFYLDADVEIGPDDVRRLASALREPGVLAVAPERTVHTGRSSVVVRWYYDVWQRLPGVREGLFGRGVIGVSAEGGQRIAAMPEVMGDDLAASVAFGPDERRVVPGSRVVVHAPRTLADLIRRRVRSLTATAQLRGRMPEAVDGARTTWRDLVTLCTSRPVLLPKLAAFLGVTLLAKWRARRPIRSHDYATWLRDESSRAA
ncbi:glycosyltransferase [Micromonospora sp. NPDC006766]|uniref:glycosyltransferase n=1 Tax=Micromonospora sp. NPDC006766 TaxID=3154778 RepID=UPI0033EECE2D